MPVYGAVFLLSYYIVLGGTGKTYVLVQYIVNGGPQLQPVSLQEFLTYIRVPLYYIIVLVKYSGALPQVPVHGCAGLKFQWQVIAAGQFIIAGPIAAVVGAYAGRVIVVCYTRVKRKVVFFLLLIV